MIQAAPLHTDLADLTRASVKPIGSWQSYQDLNFFNKKPYQIINSSFPANNITHKKDKVKVIFDFFEFSDKKYVNVRIFLL